jgi:hypothetical protein
VNEIDAIEGEYDYQVLFLFHWQQTPQPFTALSPLALLNECRYDPAQIADDFMCR